MQVARRAIETLIENEDEFRNAVRLSLPTGALQLPPEINPTVFEKWAARCDAADADAMREAGRLYVRSAYDANELITFAYDGRRSKRASDAQVVEYVNGALAACRRCKDALDTMEPLSERATQRIRRERSLQPESHREVDGMVDGNARRGPERSAA